MSVCVYMFILFACICLCVVVYVCRYVCMLVCMHGGMDGCRQVDISNRYACMYRDMDMNVSHASMHCVGISIDKYVTACGVSFDPV